MVGKTPTHGQIVGDENTKVEVGGRPRALVCARCRKIPRPPLHTTTMTRSRGTPGPKRLGELLGGVFSRLGLERDVDDYRIWQAWDEVVGPAVSRNAQPVHLDARRLVVAVKNNTWMQELSLLRTDLCRRLNEWMGREVILEIFLVVGRIERPSGEEQPPRLRSIATARRSPLRSVNVESPDQARHKLAAAIDRLWDAARGRRDPDEG